MAISMLKIRRPLGRLIFNMGIAIPRKTVFLIETAPWDLGVNGEVKKNIVSQFNQTVSLVTRMKKVRVKYVVEPQSWGGVVFAGYWEFKHFDINKNSKFT